MNTNIIALTTATLLTLACGSEPNPSGGAGAGGALSGVGGQAIAGQPATVAGGSSNAAGGGTSALGGAGASSLGGASGTVVLAGQVAARPGQPELGEAEPKVEQVTLVRAEMGARLEPLA